MVDHTKKRDGRRTATGAGKTMSPMAVGSDGPGAFPEMNAGLSPNLQAHIGRHLRAAFDEVAREPIPERLLQLLKDLERDGDK